MIDRVGQGGSLARAAIEAALRAQSDAARKVQEQVASNLAGAPDIAPAAKPFEGSLTQAMVEGLRATNSAVAAADQVPKDMVTGVIRDFHELPGRLKQAELTFKFSLEVRNKLIDAYREVMRMSV